MKPVTLSWAGGEHDFALPIGQLRALQQRCDAGPGFILSRLQAGRWLVDDVIEPIRLGLEGGGMDKKEARRLVALHVEERPLMLSVAAAVAVLGHALLGDDDDPVGEPHGAAASSQSPSQMASTGSQPITDGEPS